MRSSGVDSSNAHVDDGVLLALHDGAGDYVGDADRAHLAQCAACQARLSVIRSQSAIVRTSLESIDVPPPDTAAWRARLAASRHAQQVRRREQSVMKAVALLTIAVAAAAASPPVRRWIVARVSGPAPAPIVTAPRVHADSAPATSGATVSFAPVGGEFTVRLDSVPAAGVLVVERTAAEEISARVVSGGGTGGDAMVVLPGELRLRNAATSRASYAVTLPVAVVRLRVIVGGRAVFDGPPHGSVRLSGLAR